MISSPRRGSFWPTWVPLVWVFDEQPAPIQLLSKKRVSAIENRESKIESRKSLTLPPEEPLDGKHRRLALHRGNRLEQWDVLGADFNAIAGLAAIGDAAFAHQRFQPLRFEGSAGGVIVKQPHLADHGRSDEIICRRVLRARFQATTAAD